MSELRRFEGKTVFVTGGSSGIGQAIAIRFGEEGADVAINYHDSLVGAEYTTKEIQEHLHRCQARIREAGRKTILVQGDVGSEDDVRRIFGEAVDAFGGVDILINNAGIQYPEDTDKVEIEDWDRVMKTNLRGAFLCAREAVRHFLKTGKKGQIINIASVHQIIPKPRFISYSISKGGIQNLTRTFALEYAKEGIRVNAIAPGATITPINQAWVDNPEKMKAVERHVPLGRAAEASEMGSLAAFLASEEADYITGQTIFADGGLTLYPDFRLAWSSE